ncbi:hypothetical protein [Flavobacterium collinsii]|uniref:Uncharacterized protein n=1 Tax=Flavobacterium collinsii TaxID=1114861 RepID=A0A9W4X916_9FLAO|nr:hypothetical protein [Flavobacterium collinsii]CAI2766140.1 conserved membrane protein of unknown function [Flavobacterium collinsii]
MILEQCSIFLDSEAGLPENWISEYNFSVENIDESIKTIIGRINLNINKIFENLNLSILSGEIFQEPDNFKRELDKLTTKISEIQVGIEIVENEPKTLELTDIFINSFIEPFNFAKKSIQRLSHSFNKKLLNEGGKWLFTAEKAMYNPIDLKNTSHLKEQIQILQKNIKIAAIDIDLSINEKILSNLILYKKELEEINTEYKYLPLIKDKCNYLIKKILFRIKQDNEFSYLYTIDYQDKELTLEEVQADSFSHFDNIMLKHYSSNNNCYSNSEIDLIKEKIRKKEPLSYVEIHQLTKIYKDKNNNYKQVSNVLSLFKTKYDEEISKTNLSKFNKHSLYTIKNYMLNNEFSIYLEKKGLKLEEIEKKLGNIKHIQLETGIKNYFPFIKYCDYIDQLLNEEFKKNEFDFIHATNLINKLKANLKEAYNCLEWCKERNFLAFQLPSNECCTTINFEGEDVKIFLSSSFVLPINFEKLQVNFNELSRKEGKYLTLIELQENLENQKSIILRVRESVEKSEKKSIEILGIFSAIVLFTSGSIQIFSIKNLTMSEAIQFMLAFSYSLVLFIFLIWLITRENLKSLTKVHYGFFFGLVIMSGIAINYVMNPQQINKSIPKKEVSHPKLNSNKNDKKKMELKKEK